MSAAEPGPERGPAERRGSDLPPLFAGRFRLGALLGSGGSSAVYAAEDFAQVSASGHGPARVAVKILHPQLSQDEALRSAFLAEAERLQQIRHPQVAAVRASGSHVADGVTQVWIALDQVDGPTLAEWVAERGPLEPSEAVALTTGLLAGLGAVHAAGLVHRDVAPGNVILQRNSAEDAPPGAAQVRLIDFGIAAAAGGNTRGSNLLLAEAEGLPLGVVGNAAYLSPEQALGRPVGAASDLYQAAAVLYFLVTGEPPFPRGSAVQVVRARLSAPPPVPSALAPAARSLDRVLTTAMAIEPERRFVDAATFATALAATQTARSGVAPATRVLGAAEWDGGSSAGSRRATTVAGARTNSQPRPATSSMGQQDSSAGASGFSRAEQGSSVAGVLGPLLGVGLAVAVIVWMVAGALTPSGALNLAASAALPSASSTASGSGSANPSASPSATAMIAVPTLYGDLAAAQGELQASGLRLGRVIRRDGPDPADRVLEQIPAAGRPAPADQAVSVVVSSGRNRVPQIGGRSIVEATALLESAGFRVLQTGSDAEQRVLSTQPQAGVRLVVGATVALVAAPADASPTPMSSPAETPS